MNILIDPAISLREKKKCNIYVLEIYCSIIYNFKKKEPK